MLAIHCLCVVVPHVITVTGVTCGPRCLHVLAHGNIRNMYRARPFGRLDTQLVWCTNVSSGAVVVSPCLTNWQTSVASDLGSSQLLHCLAARIRDL